MRRFVDHIVCLRLFVVLFVVTTLLVGVSGAADWEGYQRGREQLKAGDGSGALATWMALFKKRAQLSAQQQLRLTVSMAQLCWRLGQQERARKLVGYAERLAPQHKRVRALRKAVGVDFASRYATALEELDTAMLNERVSPGAGAATMAGLVPVFSKACKKNGEDGRAFFGLGVCLSHQTGKDGEALTALERALALDETNWAGWEALAQLHQRNDRRQQAIDCYQKIVAGGAATGGQYAALVRLLGAQENLPSSLGVEVVRYARSAIEADVSYGEGLAENIADGPLRDKVAAIVAQARRAAESRQQSSGGRGQGTGSSSSRRTVTIPKTDARTKASPKKGSY